MRELGALDLGSILPEGTKGNSGVESGSTSPKPPTPPPQKRSDAREDLSPEDLVEILVKANCQRDVALKIASDYTASKRLKSTAADSKGHVPSDLTIWSVFNKYVRGSEVIFKCHRPLPPPIPLVLLHKAFKTFYDELRKEPDAADMKFAFQYWALLNSDEYVVNHRKAAAAVGREVSNYFNQDLKNRLAGLSVATEATLSDNSRMDVQHLKGAGFLVVAEEHKPQAAAGEPAFQNMEYFRRAWNEFPEQAYSILVNISGPQQVEVVAASLQEGNRVVWAETLAKFSCHRTAEGRLAELERTARIWKAIKRFAVSYELEERQGEWPLPWCLTGLSNVTQLDRAKLVYTYDELLEDGGARKVLAKLTDRYSEEAHQAWRSVAPELYRVEGIECLDWKVVHMEYLQPSVWKPAKGVLQAAVEKMETEVVDRLRGLIRTSVEVGHSSGYVHGDFRLENLLIRQAVAGEYEVRVVDFDWAGKVGQAKFPALPNPAVKWHKDTFWGLPITKEHDLWFAQDGLLPQLGTKYANI